MLIFPLLKEPTELFHFLCDLISYELFFWKKYRMYFYASIDEFISAMRGYKNSRMNFYKKV